MIKLKYLLLIILIPATIISQDLKKLTIHVQVNNTPDSSEIYITGNLPEFGNWAPDVISLDNISKNDWEKSFLVPAGKKIEYKITRGSWDTEAVNEKGDIPKNNEVIVKNDTAINIEINHWKDQFKYKKVGQVTGRVDYYKNIKGKGILPRDILVWVPPDYNEDSTRRYSVLYMQDGQNLFDPSTSAFGVDWQLDETADSLIKAGTMKPIIIVGLTCTDWRSAEYSDTDTGRAYMNFVIKKVKPFIDSTYRTLPGPENTAVGGSSLGGLISFMLAWNYPDIFSKTLCMSSAVKINKIDYVKNVKAYEGKRKNLKFYFDAGADSLDSKLKPGIIEMINALKVQGYKAGKDFLWYQDKRGKHNEASWAKRVHLPLLFFFGKKLKY